MRRLMGLLLFSALLGGAAQVSATAAASPQPGQRASALAASVSVLPKTVGRGDWITVVAQHLPAPVDQYCVYFDSPLGERPLAHFVPPGYGEQISPLVPGADPRTGIGAYQTWMGVSGSFHLSAASCSYGATPKTIRPVATTGFSIANGSSSPPFGMRVMGDTPLGAPFGLTLAPRSRPTCLFIAPEDVFAGVQVLRGVPVRARATSARLTVPATYPWGVYQIFWTDAGTAGGCPQTELASGSILASAAWAPGRWRLRMESEGNPTAGSGLAIHLNRAYDPHPGPLAICLAAWSTGRSAGVAKTFRGVGGDATERFALPPSVIGEVTVAAARGACATDSAPRHLEAYTVTAVAAGSAPRPRPAPLPKPVPRSPAPLPACSEVSERFPSSLSPARGDARLAFSTYLGHGAASGTGIATDPAGNAYIALATSLEGGCLVELNPAGSRVPMAVSLPGAPRAVSLDRGGNIWVTGSASGPAFVAKISPTGRLLFKIFLGGRGGATGNAIALDTAGNGYITGSTFSTDFPTTPGALQRTYRSGVPGCPPTCPFVSSSGFVVKLRPNGTVVYSTYAGSGGNEEDGIAVGARGDAYVSSSSWPRCRPAGPAVSELGPAGGRLLFTTCLKPPVPGAGFGLGGPDALQGNRLIVGGNAFVASLDLATHRVLWSIHLPGHVNGLTADNDGRVYATGLTDSRTFPVVHPIQAHLHVATCGVEDASHSCTDAFVIQISPAGRPLFSTYLGGTHDDAGEGVAALGPGGMLVTGSTASGDFPVSRALQPANHGGGDPNSYNGGGLNGFVTRIVLSGS